MVMKLPDDIALKQNMASKTANLNLNLFWNLQSNDASMRLAASDKLTTTLKMLQSQMEGDEISTDLEYALSRLIQGLGSERKHVKIGFSTALTNLLTNISSSVISSQRFLYLMNDQLSISEKHSTKKIINEVYIGRLFCLLSLIKSKKLLDDNDVDSINATTQTLVKLSKKKLNLTSLSYFAIHELIQQVDGDSFNNGIWTALFPLLKVGWSHCSIELVHLLMTCCKQHPKTCGKNFLRTCKWISSEETSIFGKSIFPYLSQTISKSTICHPTINTSVLNVLSYIGEYNSEYLLEFWTNHLEKELLGSPEKKYLAFQLAIFMLKFVHAEKIDLVWSNKLIEELHHVLLHKHSSIHMLCKKTLPVDLAKKICEKTLSADVQYSLLIQLEIRFFKLNQSKMQHFHMIDSLVQHLKWDALRKYIVWLKKVFQRGSINISKSDNSLIDTIRIWSSNKLSQLVKKTTLPQFEEWIIDIVEFLFFYSYCSAVSTQTEDSTVNEVKYASIDLSTAVREHIINSFWSTLLFLTHSVQLPANFKDYELASSKETTSHHGTMASGQFWTTYLVKHAESLLSSGNVTLLMEEDDVTQNAWNSAIKHLKQLSKHKRLDEEATADVKVLELLVSNLALQLFSKFIYVRNSTIEVLGDLEVIINENFPGKKKKKKSLSTLKVNSPSWVEVLVEIMLSLLLSESRVIRDAVDQAFRMLCPRLTERALQLILDVFETKNEKKLIDVEDDDAGNEEGSEGESEEESDLENGDLDKELDGNIDEQFREEVKKALGNAVMQEEEISDDVDDEELDDEAMMKLDHMLGEVFKKKKKSDAMTTKKQMFDFQARCLLLIETFLSRHHDNHQLIVHLPLPLLKIIEQTSTDPRKSKIAERATVILRAKLCRMKNLPRDLDSAAIACCHDNVSTLISMVRKGNRGIFICQLVSQCCMFYVRMLSRQSTFDSKSIVALYSSLLQDFMTRRQSKIQHFILMDFFRNHPDIGLELATDLIGYCSSAVQPYRRLQACYFLSTLCHSNSSNAHMVMLSPSLSDCLKEILKSLLKDSTDVNSKYLVEVFGLLHFSIKSQENDKADWSEITAILKEMLSTLIVERSASVKSHLWKVLQLLGVSRPSRTKDRKPRAIHKTDYDEDQLLEEKKESSRELKQRIMKEKKKGAGKKKSNKRSQETDNGKIE